MGDGPQFLRLALGMDTGDCIDWPYGKMTVGYGEVHHEGRTRSAHTLVCELKHGPKPTPEHEAAHSCGRRICINHRHLRWATRAENVADTIAHGTICRGEKRPNAKLTEAAVREIRRLRGHVTQEDIAARFGVHRVHVKDIQMRRRWGWLDAAPPTDIQAGA